MITRQNQYNQGIGKYKLLSSTAGVGAVVITKMGYPVLVSDIMQWPFIVTAQREINGVREDFAQDEWYEKAKIRLLRQGIDVVDDPRFIEFIRHEKGVLNLVCLAGIPHVNLNERFNSVDVRNNPVVKKLRSQGIDLKSDDLTIPGTHFPKWFKSKRSKKGENPKLKHYNDWWEKWREKRLAKYFFTPPRDASWPKKNSEGEQLVMKIKDADGVEQEHVIYEELQPLNLCLICENGHLSDIPWSKFLRWKTDRLNPENNNIPSNDEGENLFFHEDCCPRPDLEWTESTTKSQGYGSIYIECKSCESKVNLEGINNIKPLCQGQKPWQLTEEMNSIPENSECLKTTGENVRMQVALVTGNNMYFTNLFSSLYVPSDLANDTPKPLLDSAALYEEKLSNFMSLYQNKSKEEFVEQFMGDDQLTDDGLDVYLEAFPNFFDELRGMILGRDESQHSDDLHEEFRFQEFRCFNNNGGPLTPVDRKGLIFEDLDLHPDITPFFSKVSVVSELQVSSVQLDFTRVKPNERFRNDDGSISQKHGQNTFSCEPDEVFVLPSVKSYGEGVFFSFNEESIATWLTENEEFFRTRFEKLTQDFGENDQGRGLRDVLRQNGLKYLIIHTFSHLLMREFEFTCGYPTASLQERLYISDRMSGVLIYTCEGSEGSMGGLISQCTPDGLVKLIKMAMKRALNCSSDPLCWESEGQGILNLNLAACFSCSLTSETSCESRNLALDRRVLIEPEHGYFKSLI